MQAFEVFGRYVIEGVEQAQNQIAGVSSAARNSSGEVDSMASSVNNLGQGISGTGDRMTKFVTGPLAAAGTAIVGLATNAANAADELADLAAATGMSEAEIQGWREAASAAGTDADAATNAMGRLNRQMSNIEDGTGSAAEAVERLGIDVRELGGADADQQLEMIIRGLQGIENESERARIGSELFSRQWEQIAPIVDLGSDAMEEARARGIELGETLREADTDEFRQEMAALQSEFKALGLELGTELIPVLRDTLIPFLRDSAIPAFRTFVSGIGTVSQAFTALPGPMQSMIASGIALLAALGPVLSIFGRLISLASTLRPLMVALAVAKAGLTASMLPLIAAVGAVVAAVAGVIAVIKNWDSVISALGATWSWITGIIESVSDSVIGTVSGMVDSTIEFVSSLISSVTQFFAALPGNVVSAIANLPAAVMGVLRSLGSSMLGWAGSVVDSVVGRFRDMYQAIVGNSIVPDMRADVEGEFVGMASDSDRHTEELAGNVTGNFRDASDASGGLAGGRNGQGDGGGVTVVDMRHSVLRDDKDLSDRLGRRGQGMLGGLS